MITGLVKSNEARIRLRVKGPRGQEHEVEAVIDSGYSGTLTLPPALITKLGLRWHSNDLAILADGSRCEFQVYMGALIWDGRIRSILVDEADTDPLVGMKLLRGHEIKMQVRSRGKVTIK